MAARKRKSKKKAARKRRSMSEGLVPWATGKSQEEILPDAALKAGRAVKKGFDKVYRRQKKKATKKKAPRRK
jgi:hypothetical protein